MSGYRGKLFVSALLATSAMTGVALADSAIETVVVTAEKRSEDMQKVPLSIQVLGTKKLEELHVSNFNDYAAYLPSVSFAANAQGGGLNGPGSANVYMRGVASGNDGNHSGPQPSVGMYLDEQPITTIGGSLDIHIYDIARVEALAGPQGTLYGASSESGTVRIISNKPDPSGFSAAYQVEGNSIDKGGIGGTVEGYVNFPLSDNAAIRLVAWDQHMAGFIDNVAGTNTAAGIVDGVRTFPFPDGSIQISNAGLRKHDYNESDIIGGRAALKIDLDDNWTITPTLMGQQTKSDGSFAYDPAVGDLQVVKFAPEFADDSWYQAALTVEGKIGNLDMTYAASWMDRKIHSQLDYSDYSYFYDSYYGQYFYDNSGNFINPQQIIVGRDHFTKMSQELRIASPSEDRFRYVVGGFYQRQFHRIEQRYMVKDFADTLDIPGWPDTLWLTEQDRVDVDYAVFGQADFDLTPAITLTAGGRFFWSDNSLKGFFGFSQGFQDLSGFGSGMNKCFLPYALVGNGPCTDLNKSTDHDGFTHKLSATWHIDDDKMVYATWSTGFRPGGVNRNASVTDKPYKPDFLTNYEVGWKTSWADDTLHFNGAFFYEKWKDFQFAFLGPNSLTVIANIGQADIKGVEADLLWRATDNLTLTASGTYTDAQLATKYCKDVSSPQCAAGGDAPKGQQLPITPKFKVNATARYGFSAWDFESYVQGTINHQSQALTDLRTVEDSILGNMPAYTVVNLSGGFGKDNWTVDLSLLNAFDERAQLFRYSECTQTVCGPQPYVVPNQPRTISVSFSQKF